MDNGVFHSYFATPKFVWNVVDDPSIVREKDRVLIFYAGLDPGSIEVSCEGNYVKVKGKVHSKFGGGDYETYFNARDIPVSVEYDLGVIVLHLENKSSHVLKIAGK